MTDPHVHFRDWNQSSKETILHGMLVGLYSGIDNFFDMPNTSPPLLTEEMVQKRLNDGLKAALEVEKITGTRPQYHVYMGLTSDENQIREAVETWKSLFPSVVGLKMFASQSTGNLGIPSPTVQRKVFQTLANSGFNGFLAVHCEDEAMFITEASNPWEVRCPASEVSSVDCQIKSAKETGFKGNLHICHISTKGAIDLVNAEKKEGNLRITCGATGHHALLNNSCSDFLRRMNPPLRPEEDRLAVFEGLIDGTIDWIESDHAPHTLEDKKGGAAGVPGFEGTLRLICELRKAGVSEEHLASLLGKKVNEVLNLNKDSALFVPPITEKMLYLTHSSYPYSVF